MEALLVALALSLVLSLLFKETQKSKNISVNLYLWKK